MNTELDIIHKGEVLPPEKPGLVNRAALAWKALTGAIFQTSGGGGGSLSFMPGWMGSMGGAFAGSTLDFKSLAGPPESSSLVMAAARWVGNVMPEAPLLVREGVKKGEAETVPEHPMIELLKRPNPYYSGSTLWKAFAFSWVIDGNVYLLKVRNGMGKVIELWNVPHHLIRPVWPKSDNSVFISSYEYTIDGAKYYIDPKDVVHFRDGLDPATRKGLSPLASLMREVYADNEAANFSAALLKNGGVPFWVIIPKGEIDQVEGERIREIAVNRTQGDERGKPMVLSSGVDIKELTFDPKRMDLRTIRRLPEERVSAVIGIPAIVLGFGAGLDRNTYANAEAADRQAYQSYMKPLWRYIDEELNHQLLPDFEANKARYVIHDLASVGALQEDETKKSARITDQYQKGLILRREGRTPLGYGSSDPSNPDADNVFFDLRGASLLPPGQDAPDAPVTPPAKVHTKSIDWQGLTLSRHPNEYEAIAVKSVAKEQEAGKKKISKILLALRVGLIAQAIDAIVKLNPADYHTLVLEVPEEVKPQLVSVLEKIYVKGRTQIAEELAQQSGSAEIVSVSTEIPEAIETLADVTLSATANSTGARVVDIAQKLVTVGLDGKELIDELENRSGDLSDAPEERAAAAAANRAVGGGRRDEMATREGEIGIFQFSALLDANTCNPCEDEDGSEYTNLDDAPPTPYPECEGGALCRCFIVAIGNED